MDERIKELIDYIKMLQVLIPVMIFFSILSRVTPLTILALKQRRR